MLFVRSGGQRTAPTTPRPRVLPEHPATAHGPPPMVSRAREAARADRGAVRHPGFRRPVQPRGGRSPVEALRSGRERRAGSSRTASGWPWKACWSGPISCSASSSTRPAAGPGTSIPRSANTSWPPGSRTSSGAACPMTSCSPWRRRGSSARNLDAQVRRMLRDPKSSDVRARTSPGSG